MMPELTIKFTTHPFAGNPLSMSEATLFTIAMESDCTFCTPLGSVNVATNACSEPLPAEGTRLLLCACIVMAAANPINRTASICLGFAAEQDDRPTRPLNILMGYPPTVADSETQFSELRSLWAACVLRNFYLLSLMNEI